jgi:hypothetical protein
MSIPQTPEAEDRILLSVLEKLKGSPHSASFESDEVAILKQWAAFMLSINAARPLARLLYRATKGIAPFIIGAYLVWKYGLVAGLTDWLKGG